MEFKRTAFNLFIFFFGLVFLMSCINELDVNTSSGENLLVVEGFISTAPGPYTVTLSRTAKFGNVFEGFAGPVEEASVVIRDANGQNFFLSESEDGIYQTGPNFIAETGNTYTLLITTKEGTTFQSIPETIKPTPEIDSLYAVFIEEPTLPDEERKIGVDVVVELEDPDNSQDFYLWRNSGVFLFRTRPDLWCPPTVACVEPIGKDCCETCYASEVGDESIRIMSDRNFENEKLTGIAATIIDDGLRFHDKYLIRIEQYSISREAFQFFSLLREQLSISGDIFDPPPAKIGTNMINLNNPDEDVLGYFWAADYKIDSVFIFRSDLESPGRRFIPDDCREYTNATVDPPFTPW
jgi:hypothetical protein